MKIRQGFVTNSSSSSYVCEICHYADSVYDGGPADIGFAECVDNHIFCEEHILQVSEDEKYLSYITTMMDVAIVAGNYKKEYDQCLLLIQMKAEDRIDWIDKHSEEWEEMLENLLDVYNYNIVSKAQCPICTCEHISSDDIVDYISKAFNISKQELREKTKINKKRERERR